jgi:hypothetical protein
MQIVEKRNPQMISAAGGGPALTQHQPIISVHASQGEPSAMRARTSQCLLVAYRPRPTLGISSLPLSSPCSLVASMEHGFLLLVPEFCTKGLNNNYSARTAQRSVTLL